ncbi:unnamed protein product [Cuscuta campestris]|uniref:DNA-directed RNA polymerase III subunit RPC6 n=2 Tax=Cuscuta sect. Cleistogrammica TaxID=1824901 RepID=A0A484KR35_9ASTE|nr:hypothetical protein DM860_008300 [Cuscuta australis]VFQ64546.1 unnamed protein product [Cuscuta campestris]
MKRRRPDEPSSSQPVADAETVVLNLIKSRMGLGIWLADVKKDAKLPPHVVDKCLASLLKKNLIKPVKNIQNKSRKHFMAVEFEPSEELTGGAWYSNGNLDKELISRLKEVCVKVINKQQVSTAQGIYDFLNQRKALSGCTSGQISEILKNLVLDNAIIEVKSNGLGDYHSIPIGAVCYRIARGVAGVGPRMNNRASIPCLACTRMSECTDNGIISPKTCEYFSKWLDF